MTDREGKPLLSADEPERELRRLREELESTKRALAESEGKYRLFVETANEGILAIDDQAIITYANGRMAGMLGYDAREMIGRPFTDFVVEEQLGDHAAKMAARRAGIDQVYERLLKHRDGSSCWCRVSSTALMDAGQEFKGSFGMFTDITEVRRAEDLLKAERDLGIALSEVHSLDEALSRCLEAAISVSGMDSGGIYVFTPDGSLELAESSGLSDLFLETVRRYGPDSPNARFVREGSPSYSTHRSAGYDVDPKRLAEGLRAMAIIPIRDRGEVISCLNIASHENDDIPAWSRRALEDIASRMGAAITRTRAEEAQRRIEKDYRTLFDEMLDGFVVSAIICDGRGAPTDFRCLAVNPAFEKATGLEAARVVGRTALEILPTLEKSWIDTLGTVALTGEPVRFEGYVAELKRHFDVTAFQPARGQFACIFTNVTDKKLLEEQYHHAQRMEAVGRLAGGVAHDLNNLLTPILGYAEMLQTDFAPNDTRLESVMRMYHAGLRARDLVRQLLAFSRKQTLDFKAIDLNLTVRELEKLLHRTLREDIRIVTKLEPNLRKIRGDAGQIEQVIMNLVVNAQDAMPRGGVLTIETRNTVVDEKQFALHEEVSPGSYARMSISDTGTGMSEEILEKVFEPFFTTKTLGKGTGLGLATVYGVVKQHGGGVSVESEVDVGTTFRLLFPALDAAAPAHPEEEERTSVGPDPNAETIMVVEDNDVVRNLAAAVLAKRGYTVLVAANAQECLRTLADRAEPIDLVLADVIIPDMNGKALFEIVSTMQPGAKVIYMSGYPQDVISEHGVLDENVEFLPKPFSVTVLAARVREVLDKG